MGTVKASRIVLCSDRAVAVEDVRLLLVQAGHAADWLPLDALDLRERNACDLLVLECGQEERKTLQACQHVRTRLADRWLPILLITAGARPAPLVQGLECGADACLSRPLVPEYFLAQVNALLRVARRHDRFAEKAAELGQVQQQLQQAYQERTQDLDLCRRMQQRLLPRTLPDVPGVRFAVQHRSCGHVGGDCYDMVRLDENHVGFYVADVLGHGVQAGLLAIFLKNAIRFEEMDRRDDRPLAPHEVLHHLNRGLLDLALADHPFLTMVYGLFNRRDRSLAFARAGHPHPIYVPRGGEPTRWQSHGTVLGVFETEFATQTVRLRPGDKLLVHSDGLASPTAEAEASDRLVTLAGRYGTLPVEEFVQRLASELREPAGRADDVTLVGLEVQAHGMREEG